MPGLWRGAGAQGLLCAVDPLQGHGLGEEGPIVGEGVEDQGGGRRRRGRGDGLDRLRGWPVEGLVELDRWVVRRRAGEARHPQIQGSLVVRVLELVRRVDVASWFGGLILVRRLVILGRLILDRSGPRLTCRHRRLTGSA